MSSKDKIFNIYFTWNSNRFYGNFNGNGYNISNLYIKKDESERYLGLFGILNIVSRVERSKWKISLYNFKAASIFCDISIANSSLTSVYTL